MSRSLAQLLDKAEGQVAAAISKLEELAGLPGEDLRLLSESRAKLQQKLTQLGLDPIDTTGHELYQALLTRYHADSQRVDRAVGVAEADSFDQRVSRAIELTSHTVKGQELWAVKTSAGRQLLRSNPPKKLMNLLGYRSLESMLKRESVASLLLIAPATESASWRKQFRVASAKLNSAGYNLEPPVILKLPSQLESVSAPSNNVLTSSLAGSVGLWPAAKSEQASVLSLAISLFGGLEELGLKTDYSALASLHPAINWWADTKHLLSLHDSEPVSLNLQDVALNHQQRLVYEKRRLDYGRAGLWQELKQRYQGYSEQVAEVLPQLEAELSGQSVVKPKGRLALQLATETIEA